MIKTCAFALLMSAPALWANDATEETPAAAEKQTLICLKSYPPRCFLRGEEYRLGIEIKINESGQPVKDDNGKYVAKTE